jgi:hypothetical protein
VPADLRRAFQGDVHHDLVTDALAEELVHEQLAGAGAEMAQVDGASPQDHPGRADARDPPGVHEDPATLHVGDEPEHARRLLAERRREHDVVDPADDRATLVVERQPHQAAGEDTLGAHREQGIAGAATLRTWYRTGQGGDEGTDRGGQGATAR